MWSVLHLFFQPSSVFPLAALKEWTESLTHFHQNSTISFRFTLQAGKSLIVRQDTSDSLRRRALNSADHLNGMRMLFPKRPRCGHTVNRGRSGGEQIPNTVRFQETDGILAWHGQNVSEILFIMSLTL